MGKRRSKALRDAAGVHCVASKLNYEGFRAMVGPGVDGMAEVLAGLPGGSAAVAIAVRTAECLDGFGDGGAVCEWRVGKELGAARRSRSAGATTRFGRRWGPRVGVPRRRCPRARGALRRGKLFAMLQVMEAGTGNTTSTAPTAKILRLPDRAARGAPDGEDLAPEGLELVRAAYEAAGGSCARPVEMRPLARRLGLGPRAVGNLVMRLQGERLVRVVSMANGLLRLTPEGVRAVEGTAEGAGSDPPESAGSGPTDPAVPTGAPRVGGGLAGTRVVPASPVVGRDALRELEGMLGPLKADLDRLDLAGALEEEQRSELAAEIRTIEAQLRSPRPKRRIVAAALESVGAIVGSAAGAAGGAGSETESERILRAIDAFLGGAGQTARGARTGAGLVRPGGDLADEDGPGARRPEEESAAIARAREAGGSRVRKRVRDGGWATGQTLDAGGPAVEGADGAVAEAGKGAGSAVEDVGEGGDQAVRVWGAGGAAGRSGDAADRARDQGAGAGRRVRRVVDGAGGILRTTLNGRGEILDEEVVGHVADLPSEDGHADDGGRAKDGSEPPIRPR